MARPKIVEVDYYEFAARLRKATDTGRRLEKSDQPGWDDYVKHNKINEIAMQSWGRSKFAGTKPVIISDGSTWDGFYVYSTDDEAVLKWTWEED